MRSLPAGGNARHSTIPTLPLPPAGYDRWSHTTTLNRLNEVIVPHRVQTNAKEDLSKAAAAHVPSLNVVQVKVVPAPVCKFVCVSRSSVLTV